MANQNLLTYGLKLTQLKQDYFAPSLVYQNTANTAESIYCFLSRVDPWVDDNNPPTPTQDQQYLKTVYQNMFVAKQLTSANISPVTQRIDWTSGVTYDYYQDDIDMFARDSSGLLVKQFYVKNRYDQVFKCLWNGNGVSSTVEPFFQPGTYNTNNVFAGSDGYKWKYIYTVDIGNKTKFMDTTWMPVPLGTNTPNPIQTSAGYGNIDVINITNGGTGYDSANAPITVTVTGNGNTIQATANIASIVGGVIQDITVQNTGKDYVYANVTITTSGTGVGSGATAIAPVSPIGGHGFDPVSELGCNHIMYAIEFAGNESLLGIEYVPTTNADGNSIAYRQIGLIVNPMALDTYPAFASNTIYDLTTQVSVSSGLGIFQSDEIVTQIDTNASSPTYNQTVFSGTVLSFNFSTNVLKLINTTGTPLYNSTIVGQNTKTSRTLLNVSNPKFIKFSGYIAYIENRSAVQRSPDGIEQFKFVLGY